MRIQKTALWCVAAVLLAVSCKYAVDDEVKKTDIIEKDDDTPVDAAAYSIAFNQSRLEYALWFYRNGYDDSKFASSLTGDDAVVIPASGYTRRDVQAVIRQKSGDRPTNLPVVYTVVDENGEALNISGLTFNDFERPGEDGMLYVHHNVTFTGDTKSIVIKAEAKYPAAGETAISATLAVDLRKKSLLTGEAPQDGPRETIATGAANVTNKLTGAGPAGTWKLFYHDEFDADLGGGMGQGAGWSPYYLRSWNSDERSKKSSVSFVKDGLFFLTSSREMDIVNVQDGSQRISGVQTYEAPYLHRWGGSPTKSRELPRYDGFSAKYGYYELRMKLPNTRDGAHFAWWMVGVQTDEHPSVQNASGNYLFGKNNGWGWTNHGAEYDVMEQHLDAVGHGNYYEGWNTTMHIQNGTNEMSGALGHSPNRFLYNNQTPKADPFNSFHTYALDWNENGCDYYFDGKLAFSAPANASANYKMLHIFSLYFGKSKYYAGDTGLGPDRGIYPKEVLVDYFRVWKKDEAPQPTSVQIYDAPYYFKKAASTQTYQMKYRLLDQFDNEITDAAASAKMKWAFSNSISGSVGYPHSGYGKETFTTTKGGVSINESTGLVTIPSSAQNVDLFVIAYLDDSSINWRRGVRDLRHIKVSDKTAQPRLVQFTGAAANNYWGHVNRGTVKRGTAVDVTAKVYDQYMGARVTPLTYSLVKDIMADEPAATPGVTLAQSGDNWNLTVADTVPAGTAIIVNAATKAKVPFEGYGATSGNSPVEKGLGSRRADGGYDEGAAGHVDYVMQNLVLTVIE
jgi:hypothetical protein